MLLGAERVALKMQGQLITIFSRCFYFRVCWQHHRPCTLGQAKENDSEQ